MSTLLNADQRRFVLDNVLEAVANSWSGAFTESERLRAGGVAEIDSRLDPLIDIVRRTTAKQIEPFLSQILEDICDKCPHQLPSAHCPLRHRRLCVLYECAPDIVGAIGESLSEIGDEDYLRLHQSRGLDL